MPNPALRLFRPIAIAVLAIVAAPAYAATQRTFVASTGSDANPCSIVAPCRSFAAAIGQTVAGGEVIVQDSGGYGPVAITQSVSLIAPPGVYAGVSVPTTGITIAGAGIRVSLRGLTINSTGGGTGIEFQQGAELHLERIQVSGFASQGINATADGSTTTIDDATIEDNAVGIRIGAATTVARGYLNRVRLNNNSGDGILATGRSIVNVRDSIATRNFNGMHANTAGSPAGSAAEINVENCLISYNANAGVRALNSTGSTAALIRVTGSTITNNTNNAIASFNTATITSRGDNTVIGNSSGEAFDGNFLPQ